MRKFCLILFSLLVAFPALAQQQKKWKAPKRPKRPKWEAPKPKSVEYIDVWRPYIFSDNLFFDFQGGVTLSMAENMSGHGLGKICGPMGELGVGKQFSNSWSTRLSLGYKQQKGWTSKEALAASTLLGDGDYSYRIVSFYVDEMLSLTRLLLPYNEQRALDLQLFAGVGLNYSFGFDDKVDRWERYGYPVDGKDFVNFAFRGGLQCLYKVSNTADLTLQGTFNMLNDNYNGVKHKDKFSFDSYVDVTLGVRVHLADHYGDSRYYKVRRWEASSLRASESKVATLLEEEKAAEYRMRESREAVAFGQLMKTRISFYVDRTFVNDYQMENLRIVADFLKRNPQVNLIVKGYCGASTKSESPDMHLAEKRARSVGRALTRYFDVDSSRFELWFDEDAVAPFPMEGEWIDGVVFQMVEQ